MKRNSMKNKNNKTGIINTREALPKPMKSTDIGGFRLLYWGQNDDLFGYIY